jgi:hypothetical protein
MKIKFTKALACLFFNCCVLFSLQINAQIIETKIVDTTIVQNTLNVHIETNYMRRYLWRSLLFGNDDVCQPVVGVTYKKWSLILGANINYVPKNVPKESYTKPVAFDEQDIEILYADKIGKLDYEIKADMYIYFHQINSPSTAEFNVKMAYPIYKNITAFSENVIDLNAYNGAYYNNTGLAWDYTKAKTDFSLQASVGMGNVAFNQSYFGGETSGIFYWGSKAEVTQHFKNFYARLMGEYNLYNKEEIKLATEIDHTSNFAITIGKDFSFELSKRSKMKNK